MIIYRIENNFGFGFETCNHRKRQNEFDVDVRFGFIDSDYSIGDFKLSTIDHIQLYIGITQYLNILPLFELSQRIITVKNNHLKEFHSMSEDIFISELNKLGFTLYKYYVNKKFVFKHDKFNSNEVVFLYNDNYKKVKYKPVMSNKGMHIQFKKDWDLGKNRYLKEDMFV